MRYLLLLGVLVTSVVPAAQSPAPWPGLWGPNRDGAIGAGVATPRGFKELWRRKSGGGYSEVIAGASMLYTMEMHDRMDYVIALDPATGQERWSAAIGPTFDMPKGPPAGPTSTPTLSGGDLFVAGSSGAIVALDASTGRERWRFDAVRDGGATLPSHSFASSPLATATRVVVQTGGENSRGLLALDRTTGRLVWSAPHTRTPSYASPILATLAGAEQIVAASGDFIFAVDPRDGRLLWRAQGMGSSEQNQNSPVVVGADRLIVSYMPESRMLRIARGADGTFTATEEWRGPRFRGAMTPIVHHEGNLYGFAGEFLLCADAVTGDVKWRERIGNGMLMRAGANLVVLTGRTGELRAIGLTPASYTELTKSVALRPGATSVTGPSLAGRRIFVRNTEEIAAFEIQ
jgi:outer membrane protein assembly factor BamB